MAKGSIHSFFRRKPEEWSIVNYLNGTFQSTIDEYIKSLQNIVNNENESEDRRGKAGDLLRRYKKASGKFLFFLKKTKNIRACSFFFFFFSSATALSSVATPSLPSSRQSSAVAMSTLKQSPSLLNVKTVKTPSRLGQLGIGSIGAQEIS